MTKDDVVKLLETSRNSKEWGKNCDKVKKAFGGEYPEFWFEDVMQSGLMRKILEGFGSSPDFIISGGGKEEVIRNEAAK